MIKLLKKLSIVIITAVLFTASVSLPANAAATKAEENAATIIFNLTNDFRTQQGVPKLKRNSGIDAVAQKWSERMLKENHLYHNPHYSSEMPNGWSTAGENVAMRCTFENINQAAASLVQQWKDSPPHRAGMLNKNYNYIGVGISHAKDNLGRTCFYSTQNFGKYSSTPGNSNLNPPTQIAKNYFIDVNENASKGMKNYSQFAKEINWAGKTGVTKGWTTSKGQEFRPKANMQRDAMAAFLYRQYGKGDKVDMNVLKNVKDVNSKTPHAKAIAWMYQKRITTGYADGTFKPQGNVNRDSLAAFLYRVAVMEGDPSTKNVSTSATVKKFKDVNSNTKFLREIAWMNNERITTGYSNGTYRPSIPISREAMITFIYRLNT